jgi:signal transduction histidine kinase
MAREFINIAAHEVRTPTQAILGYSELLQLLFEDYIVFFTQFTYNTNALHYTEVQLNI